MLRSNGTGQDIPAEVIAMLRPSLKRIRFAIALAAFSLVLAAQSGDRIVYRGKTGTKYHSQTCRTLRGKGIAIKLSEAKRAGREPCKVCRPGD